MSEPEPPEALAASPTVNPGRQPPHISRLGPPYRAVHGFRQRSGSPRSASAELAAALGKTQALDDRVSKARGSGVAPGSDAAADAATPLGHHARILAVDHLVSGLEYLAMWHRLLLAGVQPNTVHLALVRGAMEGAVTTRWLVDPREDAPERIRRAVALLLDDYANRRAFEEDFGIDPGRYQPPAKSGAARFKELAAERDAVGIGRTSVPKMTTLFGSYIGLAPAHGRSIYRLLSAYAHGKQWKALTGKFTVTSDPPEASAARTVKVTANDDMSVMLTALGVRVAGKAVSEIEAYCRAG